MGEGPLVVTADGVEPFELTSDLVTLASHLVAAREGGGAWQFGGTIPPLPTLAPGVCLYFHV